MVKLKLHLNSFPLSCFVELLTESLHSLDKNKEKFPHWIYSWNRTSTQRKYHLILFQKSFILGSQDFYDIVAHSYTTYFKKEKKEKEKS